MLTPQTHKQLAQARQAARSAPTPKQLFDRFVQQVESEYQQVQTRPLTDEQDGLYAELSSNAVSFTAWVDGDPWRWQAPTGYSSLLTTATTWLQRGHPDQLGQQRQQALTQLRSLWRPYLAVAADWGRLRTLWNPPEGEEFGPLTAPASTLPLWDDSDAGQTVARWECYCGALTHLNQRLGLPLLDLTEAN